MKQNETNFSPKVAKNLHCELCDYMTCKLSDYKKHLLTDKHKKRENETFETEMKQKEKESKKPKDQKGENDYSTDNIISLIFFHYEYASFIVILLCSYFWSIIIKIAYLQNKGQYKGIDNGWSIDLLSKEKLRAALLSSHVYK